MQNKQNNAKFEIIILLSKEKLYRHLILKLILK